MVAYVDAFDSLDLNFAEKSSIDLRRLLWVRCGASSHSHSSFSRKAFQAADILARAGGIGVLALDLGAFKRRGKTEKVPFPRWFRLRRAIEGTSTVLSVLEEEASAGSASSVVVSLRHETQWTRISSQGFCKNIGPSDLFHGIKIQAQLLRGRHHGHVTFYRHLQP